MTGTHILKVASIYDYPSARLGQKDAWEIWGDVDWRRSREPRTIAPCTYWTQDPTVVDTCEHAMKNGLWLAVDFFVGDVGNQITGCELWQEARTA